MEEETTVRERLTKASQEFERDFVTALNEYYDIEMRSRDIYVMNRQGIADAVADGSLSKLGLDEKTEFLRLLNDHVAGWAANRVRLARDVKAAAEKFAKTIGISETAIKALL